MRVIVVGTSAGGVQALKTMLAGLPADFDAPMLVVIHVAPSSPGYLPEILSRAGVLPCLHPRQGQCLERGRVYIAPPDRHLLIEADRSIRLSRGPKENRTRPAIDPLFRSAALAFGSNTVGVILTGNLDDGTAGLLAIKQCGGTTVIQDPEDAEAPSMPRSAARHVKIDYQLALPEMASLLVSLSKEPVTVERRAMPEKLKIESQIAADEKAMLHQMVRIGEPSTFTCPECHGALLRIHDEHLSRFRCHTGHAFTAQSLLAALDESAEDAIWSAVRVLQEEAMLLEHLARQARQLGRREQADGLEQEARRRLQRAQHVRGSNPA